QPQRGWAWALPLERPELRQPPDRRWQQARALLFRDHTLRGLPAKRKPTRRAERAWAYWFLPCFAYLQFPLRCAGTKKRRTALSQRLSRSQATVNSSSARGSKHTPAHGPARGCHAFGGEEYDVA